MTTQERVEVRRGVLRMGFTRTGVTTDDGTGKYTETWTHPTEGEVIEIHFAPKTKQILTSARFIGSTQEQVAWGSNADPEAEGIKPGVLYDVVEIEVHSWHTKLEIVGFPGKKFNSASFELLDPKAMDTALAQWRRNHS